MIDKLKNSLSFKRLLCILLMLVLILEGFPRVIYNKDKVGDPSMIKAANADDHQGTTYPDILDQIWYDVSEHHAYIWNMESLELYSQAYFSHSDVHKGDTIEFNFGQGAVNRRLDGFFAIGTSANPFEGTLKINSGSGNIFLLPEAFFDHISDKAKIVNESGASTQLKIARISNDTGEPVFAKHVHSGNTGETVNWKVQVFAYTTKDDNNEDITYHYNNAGILGELQEGARVILDVDDQNGTATSIVANAVTGDVGYICGKLGKNADLTVQSWTGTNTGYAISTSAGNAGGIVGSMQKGATLTLQCPMLNSAPVISTSNAGGYAGGLVGRNAGGIVTYTTAKPYSVGGSVSGKKGSGGLFGYYNPYYDNNREFTYDISDYSISVTVDGSGSVGGLFGMLENKCPSGESYTDGSITITSTTGQKNVTATHSAGNVENFGGYIGDYVANSQDSTLIFDRISATADRSAGTFSIGYGGAIGRIASPATYVSFIGFTLTNATGASGDGIFGGLVGEAGNSFIDVSGTTTITASDFSGGGLVGRFQDGVLRLKAGSTNLSGTSCIGGGQLVGERDDTLIFAEDGWNITRGSGEYDDIGSWGEVLRFRDDTIANSDSTTSPAFSKLSVMTVLDTHRIQIKEAVTTISSLEDFARDAICFTIKFDPEGSGSDGNPWLSYSDVDENGSSLSDQTIVTTNLSISDSLVGSIDLRHTGLTGFTRDNGDDKVTYQGTFDGNGKTIILSIGDPDINGKIYRHTKNGLFGVLNGATIQDVTLAGVVNVKAEEAMCAGAVAAQARGEFTVTDATVNATFTHNGASRVYMGGLVGEATSAIAGISITNTTYSGTMTGYPANTPANYNSAGTSCFGGLIGMINHSADQARTWAISDVALTGAIRNGSNKDHQQIGGLIAYIKNTENNTSANKRTLTLSDISVSGMTITESATKSAGGLFGYAWYNTDVNVNGVTVDDSSIITLTGAADLGGLVYCATGKWTVPSEGICLNDITISASSAGSLGMIINKGWYTPDGEDFFSSNKSSAIYLLLTATDSYTINTNSITLGDGKVFDELVAYSAYYRLVDGTKTGQDTAGDPYILKNGNGVVSIKSTNGILNMSGSGASNTYQAQTAKGSFMNPWTRYYYNLDTVTEITGLNPDSPQKKLMRWGLYQYAHKSIKSNFSSLFSNDIFKLYNGDTNSDSYAMGGYSWYPVDVDSKTVKVQGAFEFKNAEFEVCETANAGTNSSSKSSLNKTQHYLMQEGLFRNVTDSTINIGTTTWRGTIDRLSTAYHGDEYGTGVLVFGTIKGSKKTTSKIDSSSGNIVLDGIRISNLGSNAYAPLMINKVDDYAKLSIYHVSVRNTGTALAPTSVYKTVSGADNAATSLIGNAGLSTNASNINIDFSDVKLDGRTDHNNAILNTALDGVYPTNHSIFTKASLLNRFMYEADSDATYYFALSADWSGGDHVGNVTYGSELSDSTTRNQWYGNEHWYNEQTHDNSGVLVSPISDSLTGGEENAYSFSLFQPYVYDVSTKANLYTEKKHQIRVNHKSAELSGCGTYNDPYLITQGDLETIAKILGGNTEGTINLPILKHDVAGILTEWEDGDALEAVRWDTYGDKAYKYNSTTTKFQTFTMSEGDTIFDEEGGYSLTEIRTYLAGAYYKLNENITLGEGENVFYGLGATGDDYAVFRGVIVGGGEGKNTITNKSNRPLIASSYGSVVKNLTIIVDNTSISKTVDTIAAYNETGHDQAYGAVIGQIFGGDNIIDNVLVKFNETTVDPETQDVTTTVKGKVTVGGTCSYLVPVGGYVGVVVNGALIFRGMEAHRGEDEIGGLTDDNVTDGVAATDMLESTKYLYVNPIVGRVLNGYVVTETGTETGAVQGAYRPFENGSREYPDTSSDSSEAVTMKNGTKNYSIPDIDYFDTGKLTVGDYSVATGSFRKTKVTVKDAQALFLLGALIQSGTTQSSPTSFSNLTSSISYGSYKTTHVSTYNNIGTDAIGSAPVSAHPYVKALEDGWGTSEKPYIADHYTTGGILAVTNSNTICNIQLGADDQSTPSKFLVPDGFKGLGSFLSSTNYVSLFEFNGQGNTVSLGMNLQYYHKIVVMNQIDGSYVEAIDNYQPQTLGFGLINCLRQNRSGTGFASSPQDSDSYRIHDLVISGKVYSQVYQATGDISGYAYGTNHSGIKDNVSPDKEIGIVASGGLAGIAGNNNLDTICIKGVELKNLNVFGAKTAGGIIGYAHCNNLSNSVYLYDCKAEQLTVSGGNQVGGMIGAIDNSIKNDINILTINGDSSASGTNSSYVIESVNIVSTKTGGSANNPSTYSGNQNRAFYAGGLVGRCSNQVNISNMTVGKLDGEYSGFIGNSDRSEDALTEESPNGTTYDTTMVNGNSVSHPKKPWSIVGGIIGATSVNEKGAVNVTNCNIYNISMYGGFCAGITPRPESGVNLYNCTVTSTQSKEQMNVADGKSPYMIASWYSSGGLIGEPRKAATIDGCSVSNYVIRGYSEDNKGARASVGGFVGRTNGDATYLRNSSLVNCFIEGRKSTGTNDTNEGIGGIAGINENGINGYNVLIKDLYLLANDTKTINVSADEPFPYKNAGNLVQNGYVGGVSDKTIKMVGFSLQITDMENNSINDPWFTGRGPTGENLTNSYFINADYNRVCDTNDDDQRSKLFSNIGLANNSQPKNNVKDFINNTNLTDNKPYVTTSQVLYIDSEHFLTGDGVAENSYESSVAKRIVEDAIEDKPIGYYQDIKLSFPAALGKDSPGEYSLDEKPAGDALTAMKLRFPALYEDGEGIDIGEENYPTYGEIYLSELNTKFSTFQTATEGMTQVPANYDFPVLVLDDSNRYATTELLNNYIRVLTNTDNDYGTNGTAFTVRFGKCTYQTEGVNAGKFTVTWNGANLSVDSDGYFKPANDYDNTSTDGQFTLVDVQFKIPEQINTNGKYYQTDYIAYHLYVPVIVKKMLKYDFEISTLSGTNYRIQPYIDAPRNNMLLENLETPVTLQFRWVYRRTLSEWIKQIEGGENLLRTFTNKKLVVDDNSLSDVNVSGLGFPDTDMVLVDTNNYNKPYYATSDMAYSAGVLDLSEFTTDGTDLGTAFSPVDFNDYFNIEIVYEEGTNVVKCLALDDSTGATIKVGDTYYKPFPDGDSGSPTYLRFQFKEGMYSTALDGNAYLKEDYYISFFTKKATEDLGGDPILEDTSIYHLIFSSQKNLGDASYPTDRNTDGNAHLFLGDIYSNEFSFVGSYPTEHELNMVSTSFDLGFRADIKLSDISKNYVSGFLGIPSVSIYQSFLLNFEKSDVKNNALTTEKGVRTEPSVNITSYVIDTENVSGKRNDVTSTVKTDPVCEISVDNGTVTGNYVELRNNVNLASYLRSAYLNDPDSPVRVQVAFTLDYNGSDEASTKDKISDQFPLRDETAVLPSGVTLDQIGTKVIGSSNISPSNTATAFSNTYDDDMGETMYFTSLRSGVVMMYDSDDIANSDGIYAQLGINSWKASDTELPMKTLITYNVKNVDDADEADRMDITLTLYRKDDYEGEALPLGVYIDKTTFVLKDKSHDEVSMTSDGTTSYEYQIDSPDDVLDYDSGTMTYYIPIDFSVFTGDNDGFEKAEKNDESYKYYSNYMVKAEVELFHNGERIIGSYGYDHVIYTNAKIISDWVTPIAQAP